MWPSAGGGGGWGGPVAPSTKVSHFVRPALLLLVYRPTLDCSQVTLRRGSTAGTTAPLVHSMQSPVSRRSNHWHIDRAFWYQISHLFRDLLNKFCRESTSAALKQSNTLQGRQSIKNEGWSAIPSSNIRDTAHQPCSNSVTVSIVSLSIVTLPPIVFGAKEQRFPEIWSRLPINCASASRQNELVLCDTHDLLVVKQQHSHTRACLSCATLCHQRANSCEVHKLPTSSVYSDLALKWARYAID